MKPLTSKQASLFIALIARRDGVSVEEVSEQCDTIGVRVCGNYWLVRIETIPCIVERIEPEFVADLTQRYLVYKGTVPIASAKRRHIAAWIAEKLTQSVVAIQEVSVKDTLLDKVVIKWTADEKFIGVWRSLS